MLLKTIRTTVSIHKVKTLITLALIFFSLFVKGDSWTRKADFGGGGRQGAVGISIGGKGYIGMGSDFNTDYNDFLEYDPTLNSWTQKANISPREIAVGFTINNFVYVGSGVHGGLNNNFWKYDPIANTWTQIANCILPVSGASGFAINGKGYIGTGSDTSSCSKNFWEYDPLINTWNQKTNFGGNGKYSATGFNIGSKGYIGTGVDQYGVNGVSKDFWEYDPITDIWTQKADFAGIGRNAASSFSIGSKGYIGLGLNGVLLNDFWEYDQLSNTWTEKADFPGTKRYQAVGFSINGKGYFGTGWATDGLKNDFWEYTPDSTTGINELSSSGFQFQVWPNPAHGWLRLTPNPLFPNKSGQAKGEGAAASSRCEVFIMDVYGKKITPCPLKGVEERSALGDYIIDLSSLSEGLYFIVADDGRERVVRKFVKE